MVYREYLAENSVSSIEYTDYLAENLDSNIAYAEYIAENLNGDYSEKRRLRLKQELRIKKLNRIMEDG